MQLIGENKATAQKALNVMVAGLRAQGCQSLNEEGACVYRSQVTGNKCAIGYVIADEHYETYMEGSNPDDSCVAAAIKASGFAVNQEGGKDFYTDAQLRLHDSFSGAADDFPTRFEKFLPVFCASWGLDVPPIQASTTNP